VYRGKGRRGDLVGVVEGRRRSVRGGGTRGGANLLVPCKRGDSSQKKVGIHGSLQSEKFERPIPRGSFEASAERDLTHKKANKLNAKRRAGEKRERQPNNTEGGDPCYSTGVSFPEDPPEGVSHG